MSLSPPSHVSATTGSDHSSCSRRPWRSAHSITASRTTPTEWVFVISTGPHRNPDSSTHVVPVISPLPFIVNQPANTGSSESLPRGKIRDACPDGALSHDELAVSLHQRAVADFDAADIRDGVEGPGRAFERDAQVPAALRALGKGHAGGDGDEPSEKERDELHGWR